MTNYYEWIIDYLTGDLQPEEKQAFEKALKEDPGLAGQLETRRKTLSDLGVLVTLEEGEEKLKSTLNKVGADFFLKEEKTAAIIPFYRRKYFQFAVAATILLLIAIAVFLPGKGVQDTPVYANYANHYPASFTVMGPNETALSRAETAFNQKDYATAGDALQEYLQDHPDNPELQLYLGICRMEQGRIPEARALFEPLQAHSGFQSEAIWNLALTALKEKDFAGCSEWLLKLPPNSDRQESARKLLKSLQSTD